MRKPVRNDRVVINAIRSIRKEGKLLAASEEEKRNTLRAVSELVGRMKFEQGHRQMVTAWEKLVADCFPQDKGPHRRFSWVGEWILAQR